MSTNVGSFRRQIEIWAATWEALPSGDRVPHWDQLILSCRAKRRSVKEGEFFTAAAQHMEKVYTYTMRYSSRVKEDMRLYDGGEPYEIKSIKELDDLKGFMQIKCERVTLEGGGGRG